MKSFTDAVNIILDHEGGYVFDKRDPGGETKYGISKRAYPNIDIKGLTKQEAAEIYRKDYWNKIRGDKLPYNVALVVFDFAVNSGVSKASKVLQAVINAKIDGVIGDETVSLVEKLSSQFIVEGVTASRIMYLSELPTFGVYGKGWIRRCIETMGSSLKE